MGQDRTATGLTGYVYEPRPIRFLGVENAGSGWRIKRYVIAAAGRRVTDDAAGAAWRTADAVLPRPPNAEGRHGVAVLTMHMGLQGFWVLVDWWAHGDVLMHRHFRAPVDRPDDPRDAAVDGFEPCVWELAVQAHERAAWLCHVLTRRDGPDLPAYLRDGLDAVV